MCKSLASKLPDHLQTREIASPSYIPTRIIFGLGALDQFDQLLLELMVEHKPTKILLLTGRRLATKPWQDVVIRSVAQHDHVVIENTQSNPTISSITQILNRARTENVDFVIGMGGGSVLDSAKVVALLAADQQTTLLDALNGTERNFRSLPMIAIPTTAGTGSEVTSFATVWDDLHKRKYSLASPEMYPLLSIIDPILTATLPTKLLASTGLDALAHAVESSWSVNSTQESLEYGLQAITLVMKSLEGLVRNLDTPDLRTKASLGSLYAGMAIAMGKTTISHAISYPLTAYYNLSHGYACGLTLGGLVRFNTGVSERDCQDPRGVNHVIHVIGRVHAALGVSTGKAAEERIQALIRALGLKLFHEHPDFEIDFITADVMSYERFGNNPRVMTQNQLMAFLESLKRPQHAVVDLF